MCTSRVNQLEREEKIYKVKIKYDCFNSSPLLPSCTFDPCDVKSTNLGSTWITSLPPSKHLFTKFLSHFLSQRFYRTQTNQITLIGCFIYPYRSVSSFSHLIWDTSCTIFISLPSTSPLYRFSNVYSSTHSIRCCVVCYNLSWSSKKV